MYGQADRELTRSDLLHHLLGLSRGPNLHHVIIHTAIPVRVGSFG